MRFLTFVLFLLLGFSAQGQVFGPPKDANVPKEYWKELERPERRAVKEELREQELFEKKASDEYDFFVPEIPLPTSESVMAEGNWGREALEIPTYEGEIAKRMKGYYCQAIIDTGEPDHEAVIKYKMPGHVSKSYTGEPPVDGHFHATHVSGSQVAKVGDTYIGIAHIAAEAGRFKQVYYKVCSNQGGCYYSGVAQAIRDFTEYYKSELEPKGWDGGINMSLGGGSANTDVSKAMAEAVKAGIAIFVSAGNDGRRTISFPAKDKSANAVGASGQAGDKASFSNWGPEMFSNGPGVLIYSTCLGNTECTASGTSMSSPQVAAAYGLLKIMMPDKSSQEVLDFMATNATDAGEPGFDEVYGYGIPKMGKYIEAMGDAPPEDPCADCPPCPPGDAVPYQYYKIVLPGPYKILWFNSQSDSQFNPVSYNPGSTTIGQQSLSLSDLIVEVGVQKTAEEAEAEVAAITKEYFKNRGLILRKGSGKREALAYTDYFYRLYLQNEIQGSVRVLEFKGDGLYY